MPRPKNKVLHSFYKRDKLNQVVCIIGDCKGKVLNQHSANLERHLKLVHAEFHAAYIMQRKFLKCKEEARIKLNTTSHEVLNEQNLELAIVELFAKNDWSLEMVNDRPFKILLQPAFAALNMSVTAQNINKRIVAFSEKLKAQITANLRGKLLSLKLDEATKDGLSLLAINVQYIEDKCIVFKTLKIRELKSSYTSADVEAIVLDVLSEYSIDLNQILTITSDNGSNMLNAVMPNLNNGMTNSPKEELPDNNNVEISSRPISSQIYLFSVVRVHCGVYTLQLCVHDVLQTDEIRRNIERCRAVAQCLNKPKYLDILRYGGYKEPIMDTAADWQSTFYMIERLLELKDAIKTKDLENPYIAIASDMWNFVHEFVATFKPVFSAMSKLQTQGQLCFSDLYVVIMELLLEIENLPSNELTLLLIDALNSRKAQLLDNEHLNTALLWRNNILFNTAIFLDPRIKVCLSADQTTGAKQCITYLYKQIAAVRESNTVESIDVKPSTSSSISAATNKFSDFLEKLDPSFADNSPSSLLANLESDIMIYERQPRLPLNSNILEFWSTSHNALSIVANTVLAIPISQISVKRLFAALEYILADQHSRLTTFHLEHLLFIRVNGIFNYTD